ncbi:TetR/AcrR family transcriptional regulator [Stackebrandtia nassauensis]|uniref:Transcriptional regulator, TetR family n=1 Tax=Stackebrandtia nassauensis (strain DSM 44728 / CIP 108903 / NRRL B-16338 / NBRC 102104 / LLR-40K-21) TaxID=446470 RepID=D3Q055_STANL|nr:TetR/AcrR family transcriptional regulator [Stackebrandtia nassauensis]ADD45584.1 transcriptional regulator, TetR family [Stackebrandtia nassauensis DSM 44728]
MGTDIDTLLWQGQTRPNRGPKPSLSLDRIVTAAVAIADAEGLEGLSMKSLATRLNSGVMSIYRYVPGKEELIALMIDAAVGEPPRVPDGTGWREGIRLCARAIRGFFLAHPWALPLVTKGRAIGPNETGWLESQLTALSSLDVSPGTRLNLAMAVSSYVRGAVTPELFGEDNGELRFAFLDHPDSHARFPMLAHTLTSIDPGTDEGFDSFFEFGLTRMLDGIAARFDRE